METNTGFITVTEQALHQINILKGNYETEMYLRIGVKQGGCSGMSYSMHFESLDNLKNTDEVLTLGTLLVASDPKSLLYLYGLSLDYSTELIGGGFQFSNPNASQTCGCGKSFSS